MPKQRTGCVIQRKDRPGWWARISYTDEKGKNRVLQRKGENRTAAKELLKKLLRDFDDHGEEIITGDKMLFRDLAKLYEERKLTPPKYQGDVKVSGLRSYQTQQRCLKTLKAHFGQKLIRRITYSDLEQFKLERLALKTWRDEERSHADVHRDLQLLRIVLNFAKRQGWLRITPFKRGEALINTAHERQRNRTLSRDEETRLLLACETSARKHLRAIIVALVDTALRKGELCGFLWSDVDLEAGSIRIRATIAKTAKARTVPITARLRGELERMRQEVPYKEGQTVFGVFGDFKRAFAAACKDAGIAGLRIHDLRHTGTTRMIEAGMPPAQVMVVTGHSEFSTFRRYVSADGDAVRRVGEALDTWHEQAEAQTGTDYVN